MATAMPTTQSAAQSGGQAPVSTQLAPPEKVNRRHVILFAAMIVGQFMAILDIQIVSASLTKIQAGLAASAEEITWIQTSYLIADVIMIPLSSFLCRWLSTRVVFVASAAGFTLASTWAGMASSMTELIMARVAQGFMGGAMTPAVFAAAFTIFPHAVRDKTMVMMGLIVSIAPTVGPTLGGFITETLSWRWLFFINVPPGILVMTAVWRLCDIDKADRSLSRGFDYIGLISMALFLGGLEYALEEGPRHDWFDEPAVLQWAVISAVACVIFFWRSLTYHNPIVQLRAFKNRNFAFGVGLQLLLGAGLFGATFLVPLYLAQIRNLDAVQIGIVMMIGGIFMLPTAPLSSFLITRIDPRLQIGLGALIVGGGFYMVTGITKDWDFWELFMPQACRSVGLMLIFPPVTRLALGTLPPELMKSASSLFNLMRQLGGAIGLAVLASILTDRTQFHWQRLAQSVNPARPEVQAYIDRLQERAGELGTVDPQAFAVGRLAALVGREAAVMSYGDAFFALSMAFFAMAAMLVFVTKPNAPAAAPPPPAGQPLEPAGSPK